MAFHERISALYKLLLPYSSPIALVAIAVNPIASPAPSFKGVEALGLTALFRLI